jgi:hypothetical protein
MADEFEPSVQVGIFATASEKSVQDHRKLRDAISDAQENGTVTWVKNKAGAPVAAIVPRGIAEAGQLSWDSQSWRHPHSVIVIDGTELRTECGHSFATCHTGRCFVKEGKRHGS